MKLLGPGIRLLCQRLVLVYQVALDEFLLSTQPPVFLSIDTQGMSIQVCFYETACVRHCAFTCQEVQGSASRRTMRVGGYLMDPYEIAFS
jgi:hypothetical protein